MFSKNYRINVINENPFGFGPKIIPYYESSDGQIEVAKITFEEVPKGACVITNDMGLDLDTRTAQELMDGLWRVGLRPTKEVGTEGQLKATEKHLQDMRKLYFTAENCEMP